MIDNITIYYYNLFMNGENLQEGQDDKFAEIDSARSFVGDHLLQPCGSDAAQQLGIRLQYIDGAMRLHDAATDPAARAVYVEALRQMPVIVQGDWTAAKTEIVTKFGAPAESTMQSRIDAVLANLATWLEGK